MPILNQIVNHEFTFGIMFATDTEYKNIGQLTHAELSIEGSKSEWDAYDQGGWKSRWETGKSCEVKCTVKYLRNDDIHKKLVQMMLGEDAAGSNGISFQITFPLEDSTTADTMTPATFTFTGPIEFSGSQLFGAPNDISELNFTIFCNGRPSYIPEKKISE